MDRYKRDAPREKRQIDKRYHALRRARQRFGLVIEYPQLLELEKRIRGALVRDTGERAVRFEVDWAGQTLIVVYDMDYQCICTMYPPRHSDDDTQP